MESLVELLVTAFPWFKPWVDTAYVVVTALPSFGPVLVVPGIAGALILFLYIFGTDSYLWGDE